MPTITRFEDIDAWKSARKLTRMIYQFTGYNRFSRDYGLRDQIQRAAVSIMSNIAEGFESQTQSLFITYLGRAKASAGEVRSQLYVALDLHYINKDQFEEARELAGVCSRLLYGFIQYLKSQPNSQRIKDGEVSYFVNQDYFD